MLLDELLDLLLWEVLLEARNVDHITVSLVDPALYLDFAFLLHRRFYLMPLLTLQDNLAKLQSALALDHLWPEWIWLALGLLLFGKVYGWQGGQWLDLDGLDVSCFAPFRLVLAGQAT